MAVCTSEKSGQLAGVGAEGLLPVGLGHVLVWAWCGTGRWLAVKDRSRGGWYDHPCTVHCGLQRPLWASGLGSISLCLTVNRPRPQAAELSRPTDTTPAGISHILWTQHPTRKVGHWALEKPGHPSLHCRDLGDEWSDGSRSAPRDSGPLHPRPTSSEPGMDHPDLSREQTVILGERRPRQKDRPGSHGLPAGPGLS